MKLYSYVGAEELRELAGNSPTRRCPKSANDVLAWSEATGQGLAPGTGVTATFIVDRDGDLWIADRHSEHIACAAGGPVLSAGEMTFRVESSTPCVTAVSNQSTGFCPEPGSWPAVAAALDRIGLRHTGRFTSEYQFRICRECGSINIVKDNWFVCGVCDAELDLSWNFD